MKPIELLKEEDFKLKSVYQLLKGKKSKPWVRLYKKCFNTDCIIAFVKNIKIEEFCAHRVKAYGSIFIIKGKKGNHARWQFCAICIIKKTTFLLDNGFISKRDNIIKRGEISIVNLPTAVKLLEENKNSKILNEKGYSKVKKLAILEALQ